MIEQRRGVVIQLQPPDDRIPRIRQPGVTHITEEINIIRNRPLESAFHAMIPTVLPFISGSAITKERLETHGFTFIDQVRKRIIMARWQTPALIAEIPTIFVESAQFKTRIRRQHARGNGTSEVAG